MTESYLRSLRPHLIMRSVLPFLLALSLLPIAQEVQALALEVRVRGLSGEYEKNALALLGIYQEHEDKDLSAARIQALHRRAPDQIRQALAPFGFYRVQVEDALTEPASAKGVWIADYQVTPGEPIKVGSVDYRITGPGKEDSIFPPQFPMKIGDVLRHPVYEEAKHEILGLAARNGYLDCEPIRKQVLIDLDDYEARVEFHVDTGHRHYLGDVSFTQDLLDDRYLAKFVDFEPGEPGEPYNPETLQALQGGLIGMEYYKKVEIVPHKDAAGEQRTVPIEVIATPNKPNKYRFGLGYATDEGPRIKLEWHRRYLTRWGHKLKLETKLSQPDQILKGDYRIPIGDPLRDYIAIRPNSRIYDNANRKGNSQTLQIAHSVVTPGGWRRTIGIDYQREQYEIANDKKQCKIANDKEQCKIANDKERDEIANDKEQCKIANDKEQCKIANDKDLVNELVPNITWSKTVTDDPIYTTNGYRIKLSLLGTMQGLSPASYLSGSARLKWIKSFSEDYRLIARSDLGATWAEDVLDLPASRRYFAGGDNSIRGWDLDVLGPDLVIKDNEAGCECHPAGGERHLAVGGRYLAVGSLELERRIKGKWSGAVFTDFGNAFDPDFKRKVQVGAGFGIRWRSPIGQIRLDLAFALTKDNRPPRLHIVIGPDL